MLSASADYGNKLENTMYARPLRYFLLDLIPEYLHDLVILTKACQ